jgi:hypothetical protein
MSGAEEMTDTKPTIDEQIAFEKNILPIAAGGMHQAILASLEELKRIREVQVPEEPECIGYWKHAEANVGIPKEDVEVLQYIDTLRDLLRRVTAERDACAQTNDDQSRLLVAADSFIELAFIAHPNLDLDIDAAIKEKK